MEIELLEIAIDLVSLFTNHTKLKPKELVHDNNDMLMQRKHVEFKIICNGD